MRRVVVTGMGIACPLGVGVNHVWRRMLNSESGIGAIQSFDTKDLPCKIAGQVPAGTRAEPNTVTHGPTKCSLRNPRIISRFTRPTVRNSRQRARGPSRNWRSESGWPTIAPA